MAREPLKNVGASVRARLLQRSRDERTDFQILLTRYALERLLYRLSLSEHRNRFILKGAMLFVTWVEARSMTMAWCSISMDLKLRRSARASSTAACGCALGP